MLLLNKSLINTPVMSLQSGGQLGSTVATVIDPRKLQIVALYVAGPRIHEVSVLHTSDIREVGPLGLIVNDADDIMPVGEDLVRLQEVIAMRFELIDKTVLDDTKKKLGKVTEYTVDSDSFMVKKLHVGQSVFKNLSNSSLLIDRSQIVEVTDKTIVVRSASVPETSGLGQLINPFRKSSSLSAE